MRERNYFPHIAQLNSIKQRTRTVPSIKSTLDKKACSLACSALRLPVLVSITINWKPRRKVTWHSQPYTIYRKAKHKGRRNRGVNDCTLSLRREVLLHGIKLRIDWKHRRWMCGWVGGWKRREGGEEERKIFVKQGQRGGKIQPNGRWFSAGEDVEKDLSLQHWRGRAFFKSAKASERQVPHWR